MIIMIMIIFYHLLITSFLNFLITFFINFKISFIKINFINIDNSSKITTINDNNLVFLLFQIRKNYYYSKTNLTFQIKN